MNTMLPKTSSEQLETAIIFLIGTNFKVKNLKLDINAKKLVLLCNDKLPFLPTQFHQFDVVRPINKDIPYPELLQLVKTFISNPKKTRIASLCESDSLTCTRLREDLTIPGTATQELTNLLSKKTQVDLMKKSGIPVLKSIPFDKKKYEENPKGYHSNIVNSLEFPFKGKPLINNSQTSSFIINSPKDLEICLKEIANQSADFMFMESASGCSFELNLAVVDGKIRFFSCLQKSLSSLIDVSSYAIVVSPSDSLYQSLLVFASNVIETLSPVPDNWYNLECSISQHDDIVFSEFGLRKSDSLASPCILSYSGVNPEQIQLSLQTCSPIELPEDDFYSEYSLYSFYCDYYQMEGVIEDKEDLPENLTSKVDVRCLKEIGEEMTDTSPINKRCAFVIVTNTNWRDLYNDLQRMKNWYPYELE